MCIRSYAVTFATVCALLMVVSACSHPPSPLAARSAAAPRFPAECFALDAAGEPAGMEAGDAGQQRTYRERPVLNTHLYSLRTWIVDVGVRIGAVEALCEDLLVVGSWGELLLLRSNGEVTPLGGGVPMNLAAFRSHPDYNGLRVERFRVHDILLQPQGEGRWRLFATHHYFTGECIRFRLSLTTLRRDGTTIALSPDWRTVFDAHPCMPTVYDAGQNAGGSMVADGPAHVLVAIGDHGLEGHDAWPAPAEQPELMAPQSQNSHFGKLLRVAIKTGHTRTLATGLRNPQGLAADAEGNLWETEHGPQGGDELNLMLNGANYGWPFVSYGIGYGGFVRASNVAGAGRHDGYAKPAFAWVRSIAVASVIANDAALLPLWSDDLLVAGLHGGLLRVRHDGDRVRYVEHLEKFPFPVRDLAQTSDGRIALASADSRNTVVLFLVPLAKGCEQGEEEASAVRNVYSLRCDRGTQAQRSSEHDVAGAPPPTT